jgi:hypothetical protein
MNKAEERALEAYPKDIEKYVGVNGVKSVVDNNSWQRAIFLKGYHQAEKDLELSWEDVRELCKLSVLVEVDLGRLVSDERHYIEVLKRFKSYGKKEI